MTETEDDIDDRTPDRNWSRNHTADDLLLTMATFRGVMSDQGMPCPSVATLNRWITHGVSGVKLRTRMVGGRRLTCLRWFNEFNDEIARVRENRKETIQ